MKVSVYGPTKFSCPLPTVIYCHGNSGGRIDALRSAEVLLPYNFRVVSFDFPGCGHSEGESVTLGYFEHQDIGAVVDYCRSKGLSSTIALWGRSMGAASALMYSALDPSVVGMVLDSPFASLDELIPEIVNTFNVVLKVPKFLIGLAVRWLNKSLKKRANFEVHLVRPIDVCERAFIPVLFGHGKSDEFILPHHSQELYDAYQGDKHYVLFDGDHNSVRPDSFYLTATAFLCNALLQGLPRRRSSVHPMVPQLPKLPPPKKKGSPEDDITKNAVGLQLKNALATMPYADVRSRPLSSNFDLDKVVYDDKTAIQVGTLEQHMKSGAWIAGGARAIEEMEIMKAIQLSLDEHGRRRDTVVTPETPDPKKKGPKGKKAKASI